MMVPGWWLSCGGVPPMAFADARPVESIVAFVGVLTLLTLVLLVAQARRGPWRARPSHRRRASARRGRPLVARRHAWAGAHH